MGLKNTYPKQTWHSMYRLLIFAFLDLQLTQCSHMHNSKDSKTFSPIVHVQIMNCKISPLCHAINFHPPSLLVGKGKGYGGLFPRSPPSLSLSLLVSSSSIPEMPSGGWHQRLWHVGSLPELSLRNEINPQNAAGSRERLRDWERGRACPRWWWRGRSGGAIAS